MLKIFIICTANVCRSPLGEAILKKLVKEENLSSLVEVESCGIWAMDGQEPSDLAKQVAEENHLDLSHHRSCSLIPEKIIHADLILCMALEHKEHLQRLFPTIKNRIYTLKEFAQKEKKVSYTIDDPIGMTLNFYRRIFREIETEMKRILPTIKQFAMKKAEIGKGGI